MEPSLCWFNCHLTEFLVPWISRAASSMRPRAEDATSLSSSVVYPDDVHFQTVSVAALCKTPHAVRARRSRLYVWQALTVAVVYALPVLQLLASYQKAALSAGDLDLCYYNALCAHPLDAAMADFNHVYSNIGYVVLGLMFIVQVRRRAKAVSTEEADGCGVPQHHGLLYSLGVALVTEGVLSAAYHLCPNQMNFQFGEYAAFLDSSFMYVTAALCVLTLYHGRQPDAAARAHAAFLALAALFALGVIGTLVPTDVFWALFTVLHVLTCAALSLHLYFFGGAGAGLVRLMQLVREEGVRVARPRRAVRLTVLVLANVANWTLAAYGWVFYRHELAKHIMLIRILTQICSALPTRYLLLNTGIKSSSSQVLRSSLTSSIVLVANTAMYTLLYVFCKLAQRERVCARAAAFGLAALILWAIAFYCFSRSTTKWAVSMLSIHPDTAPDSEIALDSNHGPASNFDFAQLRFWFQLLIVLYFKTHAGGVAGVEQRVLVDGLLRHARHLAPGVGRRHVPVFQPAAERGRRAAPAAAAHVARVLTRSRRVRRRLAPPRRPRRRGPSAARSVDYATRRRNNRRRMNELFLLVSFRGKTIQTDVATVAPYLNN
ncbi:SID1 transmembrane family member 1 [Eumeta japonica]|uniref:SID1 transmembrane family member 1 n=1 Tax=Eumeta variegata TaxID=151549 RepID=A0A4C2A0B4_EUMVA|nr:SID1 transmembrane family member 1 [Eumeta japonica]